MRVGNVFRVCFSNGSIQSVLCFSCLLKKQNLLSKMRQEREQAVSMVQTGRGLH